MSIERVEKRFLAALRDTGQLLMVKHYDQPYFDHWYRHPQRRRRWQQALARKVRLAVAMAEFHLDRPVESVLDVGCGEGEWRKELLALRPDINYLGLDASPYVVERYGHRRNLRLVRFGQLAELRFEQRYDLLVCSDVLHYLPPAELRRGLSGFEELCNGVAYVDLFCRGDEFEGDTDGFRARPASWYLRQFRDAGWHAAGSHCYLSDDLARAAGALGCAATT